MFSVQGFIWLMLIYGLCGQVVNGQKKDSYYVAAVAVHEAINGGWGADPQQVIQQNLDRYQKHVETAAAAGAQMILFPEFGISGNIIFDELDDCYDDLFPYTEQIPDVQANSKIGINPCLDPSFNSNSILSKISCMARNHSIVILVNMYDNQPCNQSDSNCPNGRHQFVTDVVFSENGEIITKYHKSHPFFPYCIDTPVNPELITFQKFGVEFGLMICYDIVFSFPGQVLLQNGIKHFPYVASQNIIGESIVKGWTWINNATLVFSNLGTSGSGVYIDGDSMDGNTIYITPTQKVFIAKVPI